MVKLQKSLPSPCINQGFTRLLHRMLALLLLVSLTSPLLFTPGGSAMAANEYQWSGPRRQFLPFIYRPEVASNVPSNGWPMVAANPQRTSWTPDEVSGNLHVEWYRPIEAYIPQNAQLIAGYGMIYVSTARGLYALNAANGNLVWRYDTELPLGNSPTLANGIAYVAGHDRKIHALDAITGVHLWEFAGAESGYDTNPLVVNGRVFAGNRDGYMYAIGAHGTSNQGRLIWKYKTGGPIHLSAAYKDGVIYFAANDNYAYALRADTGALVWKSLKLPGDGYHSYWPVIYQDKVIFSAALGYRIGRDPGSDSGNGLDELEDIFPGDPWGTTLSPLLQAQSWSNGYPTVNASRVAEYLENNPNPDPHKHKPWRRTVIVLNIQNGSEYTFDSDSDGYPEYAPISYWGTNSGNRYPPIVGPDGLLYVNHTYQKTPDPQGRIMGWRIGTVYFSLSNNQGAIAEPEAISAGGNKIYRSLCCDRVGDYFDIRASAGNYGTLWSYDLEGLAPGYDENWRVLPGWPRLQGWYKGNTNSINGIYHNHGDQNPIIPYNGRLYIHRSNAVIAFGTGTPLGKLPLLRIQNAVDNVQPITVDHLRARLETEVQKIISAGHLRPGYLNNGQFMYGELADYFINPGDTLYTLSIAYPYLSAQLQEQTRAYLRAEFASYFDPVMYSSIGWAEGAAREATPLPPEVQAALVNFPKREFMGGFSWYYPQHNFYAMWKYAQIFPQDAVRVYELAKSKLQVPLPTMPVADYYTNRPFEINAYIAGYTGFLQLQQMAGKVNEDSALRTQVNNELNRLLQLRASTFNKDTPFIENMYHWRSLNIARNFIFLTPELGDYLNRNAYAKVQAAIDEYKYVAPYWFVSRYESMMNEGAISPLYNAPAIFQAKAYILKEGRAELTKYLDAPAFERGDLFYIQNLVAALQAP